MTQRPGKTADTRSLGQRGEDAAAGFLERRGWSVRDRNYRIREGEIDIIAVKGGEVSFVEVKTRRSGAFGTPGMAVTCAKQRKIRRTAMTWLAEQDCFYETVSFAVIEVYAGDGRAGIRWLPDCF